MRDLPLAWMTNDPQAAAQFRAADKHWKTAREVAKDFCLAEKVKAYKQADIDRAKAYADIYQR